MERRWREDRYPRKCLGRVERGGDLLHTLQCPREKQWGLSCYYKEKPSVYTSWKCKGRSQISPCFSPAYPISCSLSRKWNPNRIYCSATSWEKYTVAIWQTVWVKTPTLPWEAVRHGASWCIISSPKVKAMIPFTSWGFGEIQWANTCLSGIQQCSTHRKHSKKALILLPKSW